MPLSAMTGDVVEITEALAHIDKDMIKMINVFVEASRPVLWLQEELHCKGLL